jgi:hypothetical protein
MNYYRIKKNYEQHLFNKRMVRRAYQSGIINIVEYYSIVKSIEDSDVPDKMTKEEFEKVLIKECQKAGLF